VQNGPSDTANKLRTAPLWGLRTHDHLMHDGLSASRQKRFFVTEVRLAM
jgi:hypothetical protein